MTTFNVTVIAGKGKEVIGNICYPDQGDEVNENSIIVIPHGGAVYHVPGMRSKAIITEIGNRLCHLAIITREYKKPLLLLPNAIELLKNTKRVWVRYTDFDDKSVIIEVEETH